MKETLFSQCHTILQILLVRDKKKHRYGTALVSPLQREPQLRRNGKRQLAVASPTTKKSKHYSKILSLKAFSNPASSFQSDKESKDT